MEQESQNREVLAGPMLCANNCGFFGSAATNNFCSKCYRDFYLKQSKASSAVPIVSEKKPIEPVAVLEATPSKEESSTSGGKRPTNRCTFCKKRVGLTGFKCRCDQTFCDIHRYSDKHDCMFDYKTAAQDAIAKANPVVKADKVEKI